MMAFHGWTLGVLGVMLLAGGCVASESALYGPGNAPAAPAVEQLPLRESVSQYGITWTFDRAVPVGRFVTGDYYVVGEVTVVSVSPSPQGAGADFRNGSMLNPPVHTRSGYDGRFTGPSTFEQELAATFPLSMSPGDSLVSTVSVEEYEQNKVLPNPTRSTETSPLRSAAVLTVLAEPVPADTFRPGYADLEKDRLYRARDIQWDKLPRLELTEDAPSMEEVTRMFERPWLDHVYGWSSRRVHPIENMPGYGREVGRAVSLGGLMLLGDFSNEEKAKLAQGMIQVGIDNWAIARRGGGWPAQGGFGNGRKLPIVLAAVLLQDDEMLDIAGNAPDAVYGEDQHTEFGESWTGASVRFTGQYPDVGDRQIDRGPYEHLRPADWPGNRPTMSESYRRCCTSVSWVGQALVVRLLEAEDVWGHDAFFAFVDRWMTEDDEAFLDEIEEAHGSRPGIPQGTTMFDPFVDAMWARYRETVEPSAATTWR